MSVEEAKNMTDNVVVQAESVGLKYNFGTMKPANTFNAHRLAKLAEQEGLGAESSRAIIKCIFYRIETNRYG